MFPAFLQAAASMDFLKKTNFAEDMGILSKNAGTAPEKLERIAASPSFMRLFDRILQIKMV